MCYNKDTIKERKIKIMTNAVIHTGFEIMEISPEEKALVMKARAEANRKSEIDNAKKEIKMLVDKIYELGGSITVYGPSGRYVYSGEGSIDLRKTGFYVRY